MMSVDTTHRLPVFLRLTATCDQRMRRQRQLTTSLTSLKEIANLIIAFKKQHTDHLLALEQERIGRSSPLPSNLLAINRRRAECSAQVLKGADQLEAYVKEWTSRLSACSDDTPLEDTLEASITWLATGVTGYIAANPIQ